MSHTAVDLTENDQVANIHVYGYMIRHLYQVTNPHVYS